MAKKKMDRAQCMQAMRDRAESDPKYRVRVQWLEFIAERYPDTHEEIMSLWESKGFETPEDLYAFIDGAENWSNG